MIPQREIKRIVREQSIPYQIVEKDYAIGWVLWGIAAIGTLKQGLVFRGGTALRKCYFRQYRFSQDLDFTCRREFLPPADLTDRLMAGLVEASRVAGISLNLKQVKPKRDEPGEEAFQARIEYNIWGDRRPPLPVIRLDLVYYEVMVDTPVLRPILHDYSDRFEATLQVYTLEEIAGEKLRALLQQQAPGRRPRPRDYYDLWWLFTQQNNALDGPRIVNIFEKKCQYKHVSFSGVEDFFRPEALTRNRAAWQSNLKQQLAELPDFDQAINQLRTALERLFG